MTTKTVTLTSYDVPQDIKDHINAMTTLEEVKEYMASVKSPNRCNAGDPDLTVWWACRSVLEAEDEKAHPRDGRPNFIGIEDYIALGLND